MHVCLGEAGLCFLHLAMSFPPHSRLTQKQISIELPPFQQDGYLILSSYLTDSVIPN